MAVSSTSSSSLGNTSLAGFGGLVSGMDRDGLIEKLTAGTQNKIDKANTAAKTLGWKQEAYRSITSKVIALEDDYLSYTGTSSIKNASFFAADQLTAQGDEDSTKNIKATGTSDMLKYLKIEGVRQTATAASYVSGVKGAATAINTADLTSLAETGVTTGTLGGKSLVFGTTDKDDNFTKQATFSFPTSYTKTKDDGTTETITIDYTQDADKVADQLNEYLKSTESAHTKIGAEDKNVLDGENVKFAAKNGSLVLEAADTSGLYKLGTASSDALKQMGFEGDMGKALTLTEAMAEDKMTQGIQKDQKTIEEYLANNSITMKVGNTSKSFSLVTSDQAKAIKEAMEADESLTTQDRLDKIQAAIQETVDKNVGKGKVKVGMENGQLSFEAQTDEDTGSVPTMTITSGNTNFLDKLGLSKTSSNKIDTGATLKESFSALGFSSEADLDAALEDGITINGTKIEGITKDTTVSELMSKINKSDAGVQATYLKGSNQFMLSSKETGSSHSIEVGGKLGDTIFGGGSLTKGQNAVMAYSYGGSNVQTVSSDTNTFDIDGISVTVSGEFGYEDVDGTKQLTASGSDAVTFTASANVDKATETVKKFIEAYNEMVKEVNTQATTKPDSGYTALTDSEEEALSEKQLEQWNEKAKQGILRSDQTIIDMHSSLENVMSKILQSGIDYEDMKKMGIEMSDDVYDGGTIKFDEDKFKKAMETDPEKVGEVFAGNSEHQGLAKIMEDTLTPYATRYATRNGNSYGRLVEEAGAKELTLANTTNQIYKALQASSEQIEKLKEMLSTEQNRYIKQFTAMESAISKLNDQSSYLGNIQS